MNCVRTFRTYLTYYFEGFSSCQETNFFGSMKTKVIYALRFLCMDTLKDFRFAKKKQELRSICKEMVNVIQCILFLPGVQYAPNVMYDPSSPASNF